MTFFLFVIVLVAIIAILTSSNKKDTDKRNNDDSSTSNNGTKVNQQNNSGNETYNTSRPSNNTQYTTESKKSNPIPAKPPQYSSSTNSNNTNNNKTYVSGGYYNPYGYDRDGYDRNGYDKEGYNRKGYDRRGFNRRGYDAEGYDSFGYNAYGYNRAGFDRNGRKKGETNSYRSNSKESTTPGNTSTSTHKESQNHTDEPSMRWSEQEKLDDIERKIDKAIDHYSISTKDAFETARSGFNVDYEDIQIRRDQWKEAYHSADKVEEYKKSKPSPYFRRIWLKMENNSSAVEREFFIGNHAVDVGSKEIVIDWRSGIGRAIDGRKTNFSIGDLYYSLLFQREVDIQNQKVIDYRTVYGISSRYDSYGQYSSSQQNSFSSANKDAYQKTNTEKHKPSTDDVIADEWLLKILEQTRGNHTINDIIRSIQREQNEIIDRPYNESFIVQGCAGSGKTMVLLHRLSVILYQHPNLDASRIWIITPNDYFTTQIKELDRNLELQKVEKYSVEGLYLKYINQALKHVIGGESIKVGTIESELSLPKSLLNTLYSDEFIYRIETKYKQYNAELMQYLDSGNFRQLMVIPNTVVLNKYSFDTWNTIKTYASEKIIEDDRNTKNKKEKEDTISRKHNSIRIYSGTLRSKRCRIMDIKGGTIKSENPDEIGQLEKDIEKLENDITQLENDIIKLENEIKDLERIIFPKDKRALLEEQCKRINDDIDWNKKIKKILEDELKAEFKRNNKNYKPNYRHNLYLTAYMLYLFTGGFTTPPMLLSIDEAQDISIQEYKLISKLVGSGCKYNLYGDTKQKIYAYKGISDWRSLYFLHAEKNYVLSRNYRNSQQITEYCNSVFRTNTAAIGIKSYSVDTELNLYQAYMVAKEIKAKDSTSRIAVICKDTDTASDISRLFSNYGELSVGKVSSDARLISVITVEQAKGLEFECVIVVPQGMTENEKYVAYTRALSKLIVLR